MRDKAQNIYNRYLFTCVKQGTKYLQNMIPVHMCETRHKRYSFTCVKRSTKIFTNDTKFTTTCPIKQTQAGGYGACACHEPTYGLYICTRKIKRQQTCL